MRINVFIDIIFEPIKFTEKPLKKATGNLSTQQQITKNSIMLTKLQRTERPIITAFRLITAKQTAPITRQVLRKNLLQLSNGIF